MRLYTLQSPAFLSPMVFNQLRRGPIETEVSSDGTVQLCDETFRFDGDSLPAGTAIRAWLARDFTCASLEDIRRDQEAVRQADEQRRQARCAQLDRARAEAEAFNATLQLPVRWDTGIKHVLSGLSAHSWGDGHNAATVVHILLLEPLHDSRLHRAPNTFLCSAYAARDGKQWLDHKQERWQDGAGKDFAPRVTCKACLTIAARYKHE
ncbi:MAG: hypothetical protein JWP44_4527 [Mucilaginibacter sp.]|nr:hypothetical protein [Mucilaginibacter sp.]